MAQGPVKWPVALAQGPGTPPGRVLGPLLGGSWEPLGQGLGGPRWAKRAQEGLRKYPYQEANGTPPEPFWPIWARGWEGPGTPPGRVLDPYLDPSGTPFLGV